MKKALFTLAVIVSAFTCSNAQEIEISKGFGGYRYSLNGQTLSKKEVFTTLEVHEEAYELMKKSRNKNILSGILGGIGGAFIGYTLSQAIMGNDANWALLGVGTGFLAVGIPISISGNKNAREAVVLYNSSLEQQVSNHSFDPQYRIIGNRNGIGLLVEF